MVRMDELKKDFLVKIKKSGHRTLIVVICSLCVIATIVVTSIVAVKTNEPVNESLPVVTTPLSTVTSSWNTTVSSTTFTFTESSTQTGSTSSTNTTSTTTEQTSSTSKGTSTTRTTTISTTATPTTSTTTKPSTPWSVLILFQFAHAVDTNGAIDVDFDLQRNKLEQSCSVTFEGRAYIFGGIGGETKRIATLSERQCKLVKDTGLPFDFKLGACGVLNGYIFLCFDDNEHSLCRYSKTPRFDDFQKVSASALHRNTRIGASEDQLMVVGGRYDPFGGNNLAEMFSFNSATTGKWNQVESYPPKLITYAAPIVFVERTWSFYVIGGYDGVDEIKDILAYSMEWRTVGALNQKRHGHGAIWTGDALVVVGGGKYNTEKCIFGSGGNITCNHLSPGSSMNEIQYPELFLFTADYCSS